MIRENQQELARLLILRGLRVLGGLGGRLLILEGMVVLIGTDVGDAYYPGRSVSLDDTGEAGARLA